MPPVAAPADKRFRRAHVKPSGKRRSRLHAVWIGARAAIGLAVVAYATWRGAALVASAGSLRVAHVTVFGNQRLSTGEVLSLLDGLRGRHILGIELGEWQQRLQSSAWVEEATLRRVLPATVEVRIRERRPMAIGRVASALYLVDANGVVVDEYGPSYADLDLPMVDGLGAAGPGRGTMEPARVELAGRVIAALAASPGLLDKVSLIDVSDAHDAVVMLEGDTTMLRLGEASFAERLQQYLDLGDALRERVAVIDYVDLRFSERLYVRPAKGAAVAPASAQVRR
jgi:cell division septal protein FtsQ